MTYFKSDYLTLASPYPYTSTSWKEGNSCKYSETKSTYLKLEKYDQIYNKAASVDSIKEVLAK